MKRTTIDMSDERKLITNMIVSSEFLKKIQPYIDPKLFESKYAQIISRWIMEFYDRVGEAPMLAIQDIFQKKAQLVRDTDIRESIGDYLSYLGKEWERSQIHNVEYSYLNGVEYLRLRTIATHIEKLESCLSRKDPGEGESIIAGFKRLERPEGKGLDIFEDAKAISDAGEQTDEVLFCMPGDLGIAMGPCCRGDFISVNAPPKRGKSWMMQELGFRAALAGCNVWVVSLEMTEKQTVRRIWSGFTGQPHKSGIYKIPRFEDIGEGKYDIVHKNRKLEGWSTSIAKISDLQEEFKIACGGADFKIDIYSTGELTLPMLIDELENKEFYENFIPDVIVVDYADIMASSGRNRERRFDLDEIWKGLRGLAQKRNICVVTGSQTGRDTSKKDADADSVAEHFGKNSHITKGIFLNQTEEEKENGIMRVKCSVTREGSTVNSQVVVLQSLAQGRAYMDSKFRKKVNMPNSNGKMGV